MKKVVFVVCFLVLGSAVAFGEELACKEEFTKLMAISKQMAAIQPGDLQKVQELSAQVDAAEPKYRQCMDDYGKKNGADAAARLEAELAISSS